MADSPETSAAETSSQRQARIRKEKREAKIRDGGNARLNKIIGLGGGLPRDEAPSPSPAQVQAAFNAKDHADPEEVDISNHYYEPQSRTSLPRSQSNGPAQQQINDDQLRQMMLGMDPGSLGGAPGQSPFGGAPGQNPFAGFPGMGAPGEDGANDPMMKMLQQMMGGMGGPPGEGQGGMPSFPGMPGMPGMGVQGQAEAAAIDPYAYIWRVVHAAFALSLGLYIAFTTSFTGTKYAREASALTNNGLNADSVHFFWIFATAEMVLLSSRFYLERGNSVPAGIMGTVMGFLPEPWKGYLGAVLRYGRIWGTVSGDAMVCVFVLGASAWLRSGN
ncbi:hypothetical protein MFRU_008g00890 [Monilinia fructicola]|uniref:GET complex subunit GET2 n=1 Tax=Monilinia fructicola TaxID=38448 RepID=A0A5M9JBR8_MONFR|nr:hypothetical protein EYC84_010855 [Monilinia fructicola]KAG4031727.1 hypothetical protein MFRU_008g00890 [Monilinia fructicola]